MKEYSINHQAPEIIPGRVIITLKVPQEIDVDEYACALTGDLGPMRTLLDSLISAIKEASVKEAETASQ